VAFQLSPEHKENIADSVNIRVAARKPSEAQALSMSAASAKCGTTWATGGPETIGRLDCIFTDGTRNDADRGSVVERRNLWAVGEKRPAHCCTPSPDLLYQPSLTLHHLPSYSITDFCSGLLRFFAFDLTSTRCL
jgi:hypothetical protein